MRAGSTVAPGHCGCNLCLVVGRVLSICHCGDLGAAPVAFATDRLRVLYSELLDICARGPVLQTLVQPPPVAAGGGLRPTAPPVRVPAEGVHPPEDPGAGGAAEKKETQPETNEERRATPLAKAAPPVIPAPAVLTPPPPPSTPAAPPLAPKGPEKEEPEGLVSKVGGAAPPRESPAPVKARPAYPPEEASAPLASSHSEAAPKAATKAEEESDEYTYETIDPEEGVEKEPEERELSGGGDTAERVAEDKRLPAESSRKRDKSRSRRRERRKTEEGREENREKKRRSRSRRRERRASRDRRERSPSARASRGAERPRSPVGPPRGLTRGRGRVRSERSQKERSVNRGGRIYKPTVQIGAVRGEESKGILGDAPQETSGSCCESSKCLSTTSSGGRRTQRGGVSPSRGKVQERGDSRVGAAPHWRPARG